MSKLVALTAAWLAVAIPFSAQQPIFRSGTRTVVLHATVRSSEGRLAPDLSRTAFTVLDNGRPVEISVFSNEPQPLTVALLIDMSASMERHFLRVREATRAFINALQPNDRVRIGSFGEEVAISPHLSGDKALLTRVLDEELWPGGGTPMWSAAAAGMKSLDREPGRRVLLILTDGLDNGVAMGFEGDQASVESRAISDEFMVYAIGVEGSGLEPGLEYLADQTGGGFFSLRADEDLASTFHRVAEELRHQYVLGFSPASFDGKRHRLEVKLSDSRLKARSRRSYLAMPEGPEQKR